MSSIVVSGDTSGAITLQAPAVSGTNTLTLPASTDTLVGKATTDTLTNKTLTSPTITGAVISAMASSILISGTAVASTSGTSIDFTGIPSWVKRITVMFNGVSISGTASVGLQVGTSGGIVATGYGGSTALLANTSAVSNTTPTTYAAVGNYSYAAASFSGSVTVTLLTGNTWAISGTIGYYTNNVNSSCGYAVNAGAALTTIRIMTANGTDTFDAGSINILYE